MKNMKLFFIALVFFGLTAIPSIAEPTPTTLSIDTQTLGDHIVGHLGASYRITAQSWDITTAIYPDPLNGSLHLEVSNIESDYTLNVLIAIQILYSEVMEQGSYASFQLDYTLLNESVEASTNYDFELDEINFFEGVGYTLDNGTTIPKVSNQYLLEIGEKDFVKMSVNLMFEQSNHTVDWSSTIGIDGSIQLNEDLDLHTEMQARESKANSPITRQGRVGYSLIGMYSIFAVYLVRKINSLRL